MLFRKRRVRVVGEAERGRGRVNARGPRVAFHPHYVELDGLQPGDALHRWLAKHDRHAVDLGQSLETRGDVHVVADRRIVEALRRSEIANTTGTRVDADADGDVAVLAAGGHRFLPPFFVQRRHVVRGGERGGWGGGSPEGRPRRRGRWGGGGR